MHINSSTKLMAIFAIVVVFPSECLGDEQLAHASWYGQRYAGHRTASGERFDPKALTAAHPTLPLGSMAQVRRWSDGRSVTVRINDRGPARNGGIDLSEAAARALGMIAEGSALVVVTPR